MATTESLNRLNILEEVSPDVAQESLKEYIIYINDRADAVINITSNLILFLDTEVPGIDII